MNGGVDVDVIRRSRNCSIVAIDAEGGQGGQIMTHDKRLITEKWGGLLQGKVYLH